MIVLPLAPLRSLACSGGLAWFGPTGSSGTWSSPHPWPVRLVEGRHQILNLNRCYRTLDQQCTGAGVLRHVSQCHPVTRHRAGRYRRNFTGVHFDQMQSCCYQRHQVRINDRLNRLQAIHFMHRIDLGMTPSLNWMQSMVALRYYRAEVGYSDLARSRHSNLAVASKLRIIYIM
jgi:hypothetical protein